MARSRTLPPREIADKCSQIRQLIEIAVVQIDRAKSDLGVARDALAQLEQALTSEVLS
jgi:hypothetical protein